MSQNFIDSPEEMLQECRTNQALFVEDKALFIAKDASLDDPFGANYLASIEASEAWETAETREDQQQQETAEVIDAMKEAGKVYITAKYYIEKAYADKPNLMKKFGLDDYTKASGSQAFMPLFLTNLHKMCNDVALKPALLLAGMNQAQIDVIQTAKNLFNTENTEQNLFIHKTAQATAERDAQYNSTFGFRQKINRASKIVFIGNVVKLNQHKLPHGSPGEDFNVDGKVTDGSNNGVPLKGVKARINSLNIEAFTNFAGNWGLVAVPPGTYQVEFTLAGYTPASAQIVVTQSGKIEVNVTMFVIG